jgi:hypothetical protein
MISQLLGAILLLFLFAALLTNLFTLYPQAPRLSPIPHPDKPKPTLRLNDDGTFNIAIFSDLHYGEDENSFGPEQDRKSTEVIGKIMDYEKPDFVVISEFEFISRDWI